MNFNSKKLFIYDPSKKTQICANKLCYFSNAKSIYHFPLCTGFEAIKVKGIPMYRYETNGEIKTIPCCETYIQTWESKGVLQPYAKEEEWMITKE